MTDPSSDVESEALAKEPTTSSPLLPDTVREGWTVAVMAAVPVIAALFAGGAVYGMVLGLVAEGGVEAIVPSLLVGTYFAFSAVGAESSATSAFSSSGDGVEVAIGTRMLPIGLWLVFGYLALRAVRWALARTDDSALSATSMVVKVALSISVPLGVIGAIVSFDDVVSSSELTSEVAAGTAFFYSLLAVLGVGAFQLWRNDQLPVPAAWLGRVRGDTGLQRVGVSLLAGVRAYLQFAAIAGLTTLVAAIIVVDDPTERILLLVGAPIHLVNLGLAAAVGFMGGAVSFAGAGVPDHISLFNFGFPPTSGAGAAPVYVWVVALIAPAVAAFATRRRLDSVEPTSDEAVATTTFQVVAGFGLAAWVGAGVGQFSLGGGAHDLRRGFAAIDVAPSVSAALGLGLLWALLGGGLAAVAWARSRGMLSSSDPAAADSTSAAGDAASTDADRSQ